jgi:serine/threonine protein kinase
VLRRRGPFPEAEAVELSRAICAGLAAVHARGVLHRDLKPANIMINKAGHAQLMDFGIAAGGQNDGSLAHYGGHAHLHGARTARRTGRHGAERHSCARLAAIGALVVAELRYPLGWTVSYKGHQIRFYNNMLFGERLLIDGALADRGRVGVNIQLRGTIETGRGPANESRRRHKRSS